MLSERLAMTHEDNFNVECNRVGVNLYRLDRTLIHFVAKRGEQI